MMGQTWMCVCATEDVSYLFQEHDRRQSWTSGVTVVATYPVSSPLSPLCPKVLMLHLKRFHFTPFLQLEKLIDPVDLIREPLLTASQADSWYSQVSVISHLGSRGKRGCFVCDRMHPEAELDDPADHWLAYNNSKVTETAWASVFSQLAEADDV